MSERAATVADPVRQAPTKVRLDDRGRLIPFDPEELAARAEGVRQMLARLEADGEPEGVDPTEEAEWLDTLRAIDAERPEGSKLFEGYY